MKRGAEKKKRGKDKLIENAVSVRKRLRKADCLVNCRERYRLHVQREHRPPAYDAPSDAKTAKQLLVNWLSALHKDRREGRKHGCR